MLNRFNSKINISRGGETMKKLGLVLALVFMVGGAAIAADVSYDVYQGWNLIAAPIVPLDPDPVNVLNGLTIMNRIQRFDAASGGDVLYARGAESDFGSILLGDGYWLYVDSEAGATVTYSGVEDGVPTNGVKTDMWLSLPGVQGDETTQGGWHLIGHPYNHETPVGVDGANITFTDGTTVKTWKQAVDDGWVDGYMYGFEGGEFSVGYTRFAEQSTLLPFHGYWLYTYKGNIAMIIDGNVEP